MGRCAGDDVLQFRELAVKRFCKVGFVSLTGCCCKAVLLKLPPLQDVEISADYPGSRQINLTLKLTGAAPYSTVSAWRQWWHGKASWTDLAKAVWTDVCALVPFPEIVEKWLQDAWDQ